MSSFVRMGPIGYWNDEEHRYFRSGLSPSPLRYMHNGVPKSNDVFSGKSLVDNAQYSAFDYLYERTKKPGNNVIWAAASQPQNTHQKRHATRKDKGPDTDYGTYPTSGYASTYADMFVNRKTFNGDVYTHDAYTAALLPQSNNFRLPMGTLLRLTHNKTVIVVKVNDIGKGKVTGKIEDTTRVIDLSRKAYAELVGKKLKDVTEKNAGIVYLDKIEILSDKSTKLGPVISDDKPTPLAPKK
jgi:hypothetical protein